MPKQLVLWLIIAPLFLMVGGLIPLTDPALPTFLDLRSNHATLLYWLTESGGMPGVTFVVSCAVAGFVLSLRRRPKKLAKESIACSAIMLLFAGAGSQLNEHVVKDLFAKPRPNISELVAAGVFAPDIQDTRTFYERYQNKEARRAVLRTSLGDAQLRIRIGDLIFKHWSKETAYSFPSGHAYVAMLVSTFFLGLALKYLSGGQRWFAYGLTVWAVAVCYSRLLLRVHEPVDVIVGGLAGMIAGLLGLLSYEWLMSRHSNRYTAGRCTKNRYDPR